MVDSNVDSVSLLVKKLAPAEKLETIVLHCGS